MLSASCTNIKLAPSLQFDAEQERLSPPITHLKHENMNKTELTLNQLQSVSGSAAFMKIGGIRGEYSQAHRSGSAPDGSTADQNCHWFDAYYLKNNLRNPCNGDSTF